MNWPTINAADPAKPASANTSNDLHGVFRRVFSVFGLAASALAQENHNPAATPSSNWVSHGQRITLESVLRGRWQDPARLAFPREEQQMSVTGRFAVLKAKRTGDGWDYYLINGTVANANPDFGQNLHSRGYFGDKVIFKARIPDGMQAEIVAFAPESTRGETTETWSIGGSVSCNAGAENGKPEGGCQVGVSFGFSSSYRIADVQSSGSSSNRSAQLISQLPAPKIGEREVKPVSRGGMSYPAGLIVRVREGQAAAIDLTLRAEYVYEWVWWREDDRVTPEVSARVVLGGQHMAFRGLAGRCMDVSGGVVRSGERLILWDCHKLGNQRWSYNERSQLVSSVGPRNSQGTQVAPFFCLDAGSGAQGSALTVSPCDERLSQKFRLHQNEIRSVLADQCVDVAGGNSDPGTPLILWPCHGNHNQRWQPEN